MQQFTDAEMKRYYPQWVPTGKDGKGNPTGITVKDPDDHMARFPEHYEEWLTKLNPPPKSEEELTGAVLAEREECIKFVQNYPTGKNLAAEIARALRKSRSMGSAAARVPAKTLPKQADAGTAAPEQDWATGEELTAATK